MEGWTPSTASQWAGEGQKVRAGGWMGLELTCESDFPWHLGQGRIDEFLEIHLLVLDIVQRLARPQRRLAKAKGSGGFVAVEGLHVEHLEGIGYVLCAECCPLSVSHELECFLQDLGQAKIDVAG